MATHVPEDHPLRFAIEEFYLADKAYREMVEISVGDFSTYEKAWREFLRRTERVWSKTQAAVHTMPGWKKIESEIAALRKSDPLLQYLVQARNAEEHSIADVTQDWNANLKAIQVGNKVHLSWDHWDRPLLPVINRGVTYHPPRQHLGKNIEPLLKKGKAETVIVAEFALRFYVDLLNRVSSEVVG